MMRIDIMDRFTFPQVQSERYGSLLFDISFPEFLYGWLTVNINFNRTLLTYMASTGYHDMKNMIKAVADLLPVYDGYLDEYFKLTHYRTRFVHDLESDGCFCVDLRKYYSIDSTAPHLQILIANQCLDYDGIWEQAYVFEDFVDSQGGWENIENSVVFKAELPLDYFFRKFYEACSKVIVPEDEEDYKDKNGENLPLFYLNKIKNYLKII